MKRTLLLIMVCSVSLLSEEIPKAEIKGSVDEQYGMKFIPGGTFTRGSDSSLFAIQTPSHSVTVSPFYMDSTEVTQKEYSRLMGTTISQLKDSSGSSKDISEEVGDNFPIFFVNWYDAIKYCNKRSVEAGLEQCYNEISGECDYSKSGFRLPTESEWEFACRGFSTSPLYGEPDSIAWYGSNCWKDSTYYIKEVALKKPNGYSLYDMSGNVFEWCNDYYGNYDTTITVNPKGPAHHEERIIRGGDYCNGDYTLWASYRTGRKPNDRTGTGFRCVLPIHEMTDSVTQEIVELAVLKEDYHRKKQQVIEAEERRQARLDSTRNLIIPNNSQRAGIVKALTALPDFQLPENSDIRITRSDLQENQYIVQVYSYSEECYDTLNTAGLKLISFVHFEDSGTQAVIDGYLITPFREIDLVTPLLSDEYDPYMFEYDKCDHIVRFDFAKYTVTDETTAFGIRTGHRVGYAGGGAYSEMLHLFTFKDGMISLICSMLVNHSSFLAGNWNEDGTRDHHENNMDCVVMMSSSTTNGYYNIILKDIEDPSNKVLLKWDTLSERYRGVN